MSIGKLIFPIDILSCNELNYVLYHIKLTQKIINWILRYQMERV